MHMNNLLMNILNKMGPRIDHCSTPSIFLTSLSQSYECTPAGVGKLGNSNIILDYYIQSRKLPNLI